MFLGHFKPFLGVYQRLLVINRSFKGIYGVYSSFEAVLGLFQADFLWLSGTFRCLLANFGPFIMILRLLCSIPIIIPSYP